MINQLVNKYRTLYAMLMVCLIWLLLHYLLQIAIIPNPIEALLTFFKLLSGELMIHLGASLLRILISIFISISIGVSIGLWLGLHYRYDQFFGPVIYLLFPVPKIAFLPVLMILFGLGNSSKIILVTIIIVFQILVTIRDSVKGLSYHLFLSIQSLGANKWQIYRHLVLPAILPKLYTALRISVGTSISVLFFAENYATTYGIGYFIMDAWVRINYLQMYAGIIAISLLGLFIFKAIDFLENRTCQWAILEKGKNNSYF
ncbi:ABC transporter permease [Amphibacillus cookii]|uniref:ABC transporter permease n=1 Tax=Amphibacillus cookii TaxID=767787 RepID=UPI00195C5B6B|nr:ABC transporter permease subunit [Amphibacillus cookii]MBM7540356.1 NitT/TauT family transport system permease protein [Amphibacillus cookii]